MKKYETLEMRQEILDSLKKQNIMPFIIEEVADSLYYLNRYKIKNIKNNLNLFINKIILLNVYYCKSLYLKN